MKDNHQDTVEVTIPSKTQFIHLVTSLASNAATLAGFNEDIAGKVGLATDEAVTNVIRHAYKGQTDKFINLKVEIKPDSLVLKVMHTGEGIKQEDIKLPVMKDYIREKRIGGLGLYIINQFMDDVRYLEGEENCCQMIKYRK